MAQEGRLVSQLQPANLFPPLPDFQNNLDDGSLVCGTYDPQITQNSQIRQAEENLEVAQTSWCHVCDVSPPRIQFYARLRTESCAAGRKPRSVETKARGKSVSSRVRVVPSIKPQTTIALR